MMKANIIKKVMTVALAVSMTVAPSISVMASGNTSASGNSTGNSSPVSAEVVAVVNESLDSGSSVSTVAEIPTTSSVAGAQTTVAGVYLATNVSGCAVRTGLSSIAGSYGLAAGERPYARFYNLEAKRSPLAYACIESAAASMNAVVGPTVNIELGKISGGRYSLLPSDGAEIQVSLGIPKSFAQDGKTFAMVCVRPGGAVSILTDQDTNPDTITFNTTGGQGAYAIIKY